MIVFDVEHKDDNFDEPIQAIGAVNVNTKSEFVTSTRALKSKVNYADALRCFESSTGEIGQGVNLEALMLSQLFRWAEALPDFEGISYCFDEERSEIARRATEHGVKNPFREIRDLKELYLRAASTVRPATREEIIRYAGITGVDYYNASPIAKARIAGEVLLRISVGKSLFTQFRGFKIPSYLAS